MDGKKFIAHTTDGDMPCEVHGDIAIGEAQLKANILAKYPTATFSDVEE